MAIVKFNALIIVSDWVMLISCVTEQARAITKAKYDSIIIHMATNIIKLCSMKEAANSRFKVLNWNKISVYEL